MTNSPPRCLPPICDQLDPGQTLFSARKTFTQFKKYQLQLDDEMKGKVVHFYKVVNTAFRQRLNESEIMVEELLKQPFTVYHEGSIQYQYR